VGDALIELSPDADDLPNVYPPEQEALIEDRPEKIMIEIQGFLALAVQATMKFRPGSTGGETGRPAFPSDPVDNLYGLHDLFGGGVQVVRPHDAGSALSIPGQDVPAGAVAHDAPED